MRVGSSLGLSQGRKRCQGARAGWGDCKAPRGCRSERAARKKEEASGKQQADCRLQPNPTTQAHQVDLWVKLILDWARAERVWSVHLDAGAGDLGEVFENKQIRRALCWPVGWLVRGEVLTAGRLMPASIRIVLAAMVKDGQLERPPAGRS